MPDNNQHWTHAIDRLIGRIAETRHQTHHRFHLAKELIMSALSDLQAAVTAEDTVVDSAVTLLQGLKAALDAAGTDPVALKALSDDIGAKTQQLSAAVVANTPAA